MREYLMKAIQDDARRAGERDRLLREARRARRARRRTERGKIVLSGSVTLDGVIQDPAGDEGFRAGCWAELGAAAVDALVSRVDGTPPANIEIPRPDAAGGLSPPAWMIPAFTPGTAVQPRRRGRPWRLRRAGRQ